MSKQRVIIEMGSGNDQYGQDYTKAALRAVENAIRHSSLPLFESIGLPYDEMLVRVTIGVQEPDKVDAAAVSAFLPRGSAQTSVVKGGLNVSNTDTGQTIVIASAAVEAFLPGQSAHWRLAT